MMMIGFDFYMDIYDWIFILTRQFIFYSKWYFKPHIKTVFKVKIKRRS